LVHVGVHPFHQFILNVDGIGGGTCVDGWVELEIELVLVGFIGKSENEHFCIDSVEFERIFEHFECDEVVEVDEGWVSQVELGAVVFSRVSNTHFYIGDHLFHAFIGSLKGIFGWEHVEEAVHEVGLVKWLQLGFKVYRDWYFIQILQVFGNMSLYQNF